MLLVILYFLLDSKFFLDWQIQFVIVAASCSDDINYIFALQYRYYRILPIMGAANGVIFSAEETS